MLDLDKLYTDFQELLNTFDSKALDTWLKLDNERFFSPRLISGQAVSFPCNILQITSPNVSISEALNKAFQDDNSYNVAA